MKTVVLKKVLFNKELNIHLKHKYNISITH